MNSTTHEAFGRILARLTTYHGFAPGAHDMLLADVDLFARSMRIPDEVHGVAIRMPGGELATEVLGHATEPLCHFEPGYLWSLDPSLYHANVLVDVAARLCGATVELRSDGTRPPLVPIPEDSPFQHALAMQSDRVITGFRFPAASEMAAFYARGARLWLTEYDKPDVPGWIGCAAYACHLVQDCCIPYHSQGALLAGHADFEDRLCEHFATDFDDAVGMPVNGDLVAAIQRDRLAVRDCSTVAELCVRCAGWSRAKWPDLDALADSQWDVSLAICVRALAASVRAIAIMTEAAT